LQLKNSLLVAGLVWPPTLAVVSGLAVLVSLLPALGAYRVSVPELLQNRQCQGNS